MDQLTHRATFRTRPPPHHHVLVDPPLSLTPVLAYTLSSRVAVRVFQQSSTPPTPAPAPSKSACSPSAQASTPPHPWRSPLRPSLQTYMSSHVAVASSTANHSSTPLPGTGGLVAGPSQRANPPALIPPSIPPFHRADTLHIKQKLHDALGEAGLPYWKALNAYLLGQVGRDELATLVRGWFKGEHRKWHFYLRLNITKIQLTQKSNYTTSCSRACCTMRRVRRCRIRPRRRSTCTRGGGMGPTLIRMQCSSSRGTASDSG